MIANLFSFGWIDVFVGGGSTFVFLGLGLILFGRFQKQVFIQRSYLLGPFLVCDFLFHFHVYDCLGTLLPSRPTILL